MILIRLLHLLASFYEILCASPKLSAGEFNVYSSRAAKQSKLLFLASVSVEFPLGLTNKLTLATFTLGLHY